MLSRIVMGNVIEINKNCNQSCYTISGKAFSTASENGAIWARIPIGTEAYTVHMINYKHYRWNDNEIIVIKNNSINNNIKRYSWPNVSTIIGRAHHHFIIIRIIIITIITNNNNITMIKRAHLEWSIPAVQATGTLCGCVPEYFYSFDVEFNGTTTTRKIIIIRKPLRLPHQLRMNPARAIMSDHLRGVIFDRFHLPVRAPAARYIHNKLIITDKQQQQQQKQQ